MLIFWFSINYYQSWRKKFFYKVKSNQRLPFFSSVHTVWPVCVSKCSFPTVSPHQLLPILPVSTPMLPPWNGTWPSLPLLPRTRCTSAPVLSCQSTYCIVKTDACAFYLIPEVLSTSKMCLFPCLRKYADDHSFSTHSLQQLVREYY